MGTQLEQCKILQQEMQEHSKDQVTAIDGCRGGWISCSWSESTGWEFNKHQAVAQVYSMYADCDLFLIDMPIGLPGRNTDRNLEQSVRDELKPLRHSSVFNVPVREVLYCMEYNPASKKNRRLTGKGLSRQSFNILPGIRELDEFIQGTPGSEIRFFECHPELCFKSMAGSPCEYSKHSKEGKEQRKELIGSKCRDLLLALDEFVANSGASIAKDAIDASLMCLRGKLKDEFPLKVLTDPSITDDKGIPMRIVY